MKIETLATRPDLLEPALAIGLVDAEFMQHDPIGALTRARRLAQRWPDYFHVVLADDGTPAARAVSVPLRFPTPDRAELPDHGWDGAIIWAAEDALDGVAPTALCALDVQVADEHRGRGVAAHALAAVRATARSKGLARLVIPVRPTGKHRHPHEPMETYLRRRRPDGLPEDPWLRTHERLGARIVKVCPFAMYVAGTLEQWRQWTGREFDTDGDTTVPGGLSPVLVSTRQNLGVYVEPNVWMEHPVQPGIVR